MAPGVFKPIMDGGTRNTLAISSTANWRDSSICACSASLPTFVNFAPPDRTPGLCDFRRPLCPASKDSTTSRACSCVRLPGNSMMPPALAPLEKYRDANSSRALDNPSVFLTSSMRDVPMRFPGLRISVMYRTWSAVRTSLPSTTNSRIRVAGLRRTITRVGSIGCRATTSPDPPRITCTTAPCDSSIETTICL